MPGVFVEMKIEGLDKVLEKLGARLENAIVGAVKTGLYEKGLEMETEMKGECPHKTGTMRREIQAQEPEVEG
jgi:hypothetical protein